jgi:hypothetical protein
MTILLPFLVALVVLSASASPDLCADNTCTQPNECYSSHVNNGGDLINLSAPCADDSPYSNLGLVLDAIQMREKYGRAVFIEFRDANVTDKRHHFNLTQYGLPDYNQAVSCINFSKLTIDFLQPCRRHTRLR